jgi:hypothetical protein
MRAGRCGLIWSRMNRRLLYSSLNRPASVALEAVGKLERPPVKQNVPRPGWLPTAADQPAWSSPEPDVELETMEDSAASGTAPEPSNGHIQPSPQLEHASSYLSRQIHRDGTQTRYQVEKILAGMSPGIRVDDLLECAVMNSWLVVNGDRISPGQDYPEWMLERDTSARYVVVS